MKHKLVSERQRIRSKRKSFSLCRYQFERASWCWAPVLFTSDWAGGGEARQYYYDRSTSLHSSLLPDTGQTTVTWSTSTSTPSSPCWRRTRKDVRRTDSGNLRSRRTGTVRRTVWAVFWCAVTCKMLNFSTGSFYKKSKHWRQWRTSTWRTARQQWGPWWWRTTLTPKCLTQWPASQTVPLLSPPGDLTLLLLPDLLTLPTWGDQSGPGPCEDLSSLLH